MPPDRPVASPVIRRRYQDTRSPSSPDTEPEPADTEPDEPATTEPDDPDPGPQNTLVGAGEPGYSVDPFDITLAIIGFITLVGPASWWMVRRDDPDADPTPPPDHPEPPIGDIISRPRLELVAVRPGLDQVPSFSRADQDMAGAVPPPVRPVSSLGDAHRRHWKRGPHPIMTPSSNVSGRPRDETSSRTSTVGVASGFDGVHSKEAPCLGAGRSLRSPPDAQTRRCEREELPCPSPSHVTIRQPDTPRTRRGLGKERRDAAVPWDVLRIGERVMVHDDLDPLFEVRTGTVELAQTRRAGAAIAASPTDADRQATA